MKSKLLSLSILLMGSIQSRCFFIKEIKFMEELKESGFNSTYCVTLVQNKNFYSGQKQDGVYAYFRGA